METVTISCIGDVMPADTSYTLGRGIGTGMPKLVAHVAENGNNPFTGSDAVVCNLEAPLVWDGTARDLPFAGNPAIMQLMRAWGVKVVSVANNHMLDHGIDIFNQTTGSLSENRFLPIGLNREGTSNPAFLEIRGRKFAFAAFNDVHDHEDEAFLATCEKNVLLDTLAAIKKTSPDHIIFCLHWGNEYINYPSPMQVELARELVDQGVNVIVGHHPHVVQPVEAYHGGLIFYSLGNFLFDMFWSENVRNGMQADLLFHSNGTIGYQLKPFRIDSNFIPDYTHTAPVLLALERAGKMLDAFRQGTSHRSLVRYHRQCRKRRLQARLQMKFYLFRELFHLSPRSRALVLKNMKSRLLWKKG